MKSTDWRGSTCALHLDIVQRKGENVDAQYEEVNLGPITKDRRISSSLAPFHRVSEPIRYPRVVAEALAELYGEYCEVLAVPGGAVEYDTDFRFCEPAAFAVQIDMAGLSRETLDELAVLPLDEVREILRGRIFEIESSVAMYALLEQLFGSRLRRSAFRKGWRGTLADTRRRTGKPVALLAVTDEKYTAMAETEFGADPSARLSPRTVRRLTGFDAFLGPEDFRRLVKDNGGDCPYALFVRASDPVAKLRKPGAVVDHPLLGDPELRRVIRSNTVTLNVDDPAAPWEQQVNDTKAYMPDMGLGYVIAQWEDLADPDFDTFLKSRDIDPQDVQDGLVTLRAKPLVAAYGGYGHLRGTLTDKKFRSELRREMKKRGGYIIQPEIPASMVYDPVTGMRAGYIDRLFLGWVNGRPQPISGFRNFMPAGSGELEAGRIHGNGQAFWGEILLR